jgi:hypothetical protein
MEEYSDKDVKMYYDLCLTTLQHYEKIMIEYDKFSETEKLAISICYTESKNDFLEIEAELERRGILHMNYIPSKPIKSE